MEGTMGRKVQVALACAAFVLASLAATGSAFAMKKTVCASKCAFTSIQAAINAAAEGSTITIGKGTYVENVVVNKPLTLEGSGKETVIEPAISTPVCSGGSLCGGAASNIVLVEANNVTIANMKLEGDNPSLTSGVVVGGKDIDARNGIITNHAVGVFNDLTVTKVIVDDIYLRGIYASSGGTFDFNHDTVQNVQAEEASIAMFAFEGSGVMEDNRVSEANDAISANWSKGTHFVGNRITKSGSGIHTDNNGGSGGSADVISGNKVSECKTNGYGIWVFVPYVSATVEGNKIKGCAVGLAAFGGAVSGQGPTFASNKVDDAGATVSEGPTYGAYVTTDQLGFEFGDVTATFTGNSIKGAGTGLLVTQTSPTPGQPAGGQATVNASGNAIYKNTTGADGEAGTKVEAQNNWWGCKQGPANAKCNAATGTVSYTPWLTTKP
jgi:nitrous oxidase accessory protein NosD